MKTTDVSSIDDKTAKLREGKKAGDDFEARCVGHNRSQIQDGADVNPSFRCKNEGCSATKEIDHVTRASPGGPITKIVQCKSDQSKLDPTKKGVIIKPSQLREDRKLKKSIDKCQEGEPPWYWNCSFPSRPR